VDGQEWIESSGLRLVDSGVRIEAETLEQGAQPGRGLGMVRARIVLQAVGMGEDSDRHEVK
jgi:hypothetical protein